MSNPYPPAQSGYNSSYGQPGGYSQGGGYAQTGYGHPPPSQGHYGQQGGGQAHGAGSGYGAPGGPPPGYAGGRPPPPTNQHSRPPPSQFQGDPQLHSWFVAVDRDGSGHITAVELQQALMNGDMSAFDIDTVKMLLNIFDRDRSGSIGEEEFGGIWRYVKDWQGVFRHFDRDGSGTIAGHELADSMRQFGYNLPPNLLQILERKYVAGGLPSARNRDGGITFDRFVRCCVVVKTLTEAFQQADTDRDGWVQFSYHQFMEVALSAP